MLKNGIHFDKKNHNYLKDFLESEDKLMKNALDRARELEAEAKAIRRQEQAFWEEVADRWEEIILSDKIKPLLSDLPTFRVGEIVFDVCGDISNFDSFREYIERYRAAIQRTQSPTEENSPERNESEFDEVYGG